MEVLDRAFQACELLLEEMELEKISVSSALMRCLRIARLLHDTEAMVWLRYEYGGYPRNADGTISPKVRDIARSHGRVYQSNGNERVFFTLASELEKRMDGYRQAAKMQDGWYPGGMRNPAGYGTYTGNREETSLTAAQLLSNMTRDQRQLVSLSSAYYSYALRKYAEISAGSIAESIIGLYREHAEEVWNYLNDFDVLSLDRLSSLMEYDLSGNAKEILGICRHLLEHILDRISENVDPVDEFTAADLRLLLQRIENQLVQAERGASLQKAELNSSVIRTYIAAVDLTAQLKK